MTDNSLEKVEAPKEEKKEGRKKQLKEDLRFIVVFIFFFSLFRFFVYDWYIVPSSSMVPTLLIGDMPFVEKFAYGFS
ncbi:MAG: S26 family signal peptidase, partial [Holosporaceae bacterium]|nr:S26 family signal peptidase [Holosporaceae bacterium]